MKKVQPGDSLQIPAKAYNAFVDAALDHQKRRMSTSGDPLREKDQTNIVLVKNESGSARSRFDVLGITGPIITRADNAAMFQSRIALRGVTPTATHAGRFVILMGAVPDGAIGRAFIAGACLARVRMLDEAHTAADVDDGQAGQLASGEAGAASLLWVEPVGERADPAIAWAVIRFGGVGTATSGDTPDLSSQFILAFLKSVQRFGPINPDLPAYHWKQAQLNSDGAAVEVALGEGSKITTSCDSVVVQTESGSYSVLADPATGENLTSAVHDALNSTMTFRITGTLDTTHTVTSYRIQVGTGTGPALRATYGDSGLLPSGQPPTFVVSGVPLATNVYIRVITATSGSGTNHNVYIVQVGLNGAPVNTIAVSVQDLTDPAGALLTAPVSGEFNGAIAEDQTDLAIAWSAVPGATHYYVNAGTGSGDPNTDPTTWNLADHDVGSALADTLTGVPANGTPFYITVWWRFAPSFDWCWNRWRVVITPAPDRRVIILQDLNRIATESQVGLAGLVEIPDPPTEGDPPDEADIETELAVPILARIWRTTDTAGLDRFVGEYIDQEYLAEIVDESALGADDDYTDARYWLKLIKVDNADPDNGVAAPLAFSDATHAAARVITAENLAESKDGTHELAAGTRVLVRGLRGGDKPWITRFVFNAGGTGGGARFLAKIQSQGPNAEADYTDARYWVQEVDDSTSAETDPLALAEVPVGNGGRWVTAHNIVELGSAGGAGGHYIRKAVTGISVPTRYVIVREVRLTTGKKYITESHPGQIQPNMFAFLVSCLDASGCPEGSWYQMEGPGFKAKQDPGAC